MDAFSFGIMVICLCSSINIKLDNPLVEKKSLFPALADLHKLLRNCLLSAASTIQSLLRIRPLYMGTKMISGQGLGTISPGRSGKPIHQSNSAKEACWSCISRISGGSICQYPPSRCDPGQWNESTRENKAENEAEATQDEIRQLYEEGEAVGKIS